MADLTARLGGKAPSTMITITLAAIHSKQPETLVEFRDCTKTRDISHAGAWEKEQSSSRAHAPRGHVNNDDEVW
jgi:hypothetical protein